MYLSPAFSHTQIFHYPIVLMLHILLCVLDNETTCLPHISFHYIFIFRFKHSNIHSVLFIFFKSSLFHSSLALCHLAQVILFAHQKHKTIFIHLMGKVWHCEILLTLKIICFVSLLSPHFIFSNLWEDYMFIYWMEQTKKTSKTRNRIGLFSKLWNNQNRSLLWVLNIQNPNSSAIWIMWKCRHH